MRNNQDHLNPTKEMYKYMKSHQIRFPYFFFDSLSRSKYIDIQDIISNPEIPWNYSKLSANLNITWKVINNYPNIPWDYEYIVYNDMSEPKKYAKLKREYNFILKELLY